MAEGGRKQGRRVTALDPRTLAIAWQTMEPALIGPPQIVFVAAGPATTPGRPGTGAGGGAAGIPPWPPAAALLLGLLAAAAAGRLPRLRRR